MASVIAASVLAGVLTSAVNKAIGLNSGGLIEKDGLYELHKGELVIPAGEAKKMLAEYKKAKGIKSKDKFQPKVLKPKDLKKKK